MFYDTHKDMHRITEVFIILNRSKLIYAVICIMFLLGSPSLFGQVSFATNTDFTTGSTSLFAVPADINGDGLKDLAVVNYDSNSVSVFLNLTTSGASTPSLSAKTDFTTGSAPISAAAADLNGDGKMDLAVANANSNTVSVFLNTTSPGASTPSFTAKTDFTTGSFPRSVAAADINGDGKPDLIVANYAGSSVSVLLNTTTPGDTTPTFSAKTDFLTGGTPYSVAVADINGDGKPDLAVSNGFNNTVSVFLNTTATGASTPTFSAYTSFAAGSIPRCIAAADINGDGKPDLVVTNSNDNTVSVFLNTTAPGASTPTFSAKTDLTTGSAPYFVAAADLNGDGKPDLIAANNSGNSVSVFLNTTSLGASTPTFSAKTDFTTGSSPQSIASADLNGDGKPDLVTADYSGNSVSVLLNTTTTGFSATSFSAKTDFTTGSGPQSLASADLNGDGKQDLVAANKSSNTVSVFLNTTTPGASTPSFSAKTDFTTGSAPVSVASADLNGDGVPDIVAANSGSNTISVFINTTSPGASTPSFTLKTDFTTGSTPSSVAVADLNGDGKPDLVAVNSSSNTVSVFFNTTTPGDTVPSFSAKTDFTTGSTPTSVAVADLNGDGMPDLAVANSNGSSVSVLLNTTSPGASTPSFSAKTDFPITGIPETIFAADLNNDGKQDLAVANTGSKSVSVLLNTTSPGAAAPSFSAVTNFTSGISPFFVVPCDINDDGKTDFVTANSAGNSASIFLNTSSPGDMIPSFSARTDFTTGSAPKSVIAVDLNGDGKPDLVTANYSGNSISVLLNTTTVGISSPSFSQKTELSTPDLNYSDAIADLNGDGKPDLVIETASGTSVFLNTTPPGASTPSFSARTNFAFGGNSVVIADINGDGKPDLITNSLDVLLNTTPPGASTPSFSAGTYFTTSGSPEFAAVADFNGDGKPDLVTADYVFNYISVLLNTTTPGASTPSFSANTDFVIGNPGYSPYSVAVADLNGDGKPDLVVGDYSGALVSVLLNTTTPGASTPSFSANTDYYTSTGGANSSVAVADLNGDGKPDLIMGGTEISVFLNTTAPGASTPSFSPATYFAAASGDFVAAADINGDGKPDLILAGNIGYNVSVLLNTTAPGASTPTFSGSTNFATGNSPFTVAVADLNGDGKPDLVTANYVDSTASVLLNSALLPLPVELTTFTASITGKSGQAISPSVLLKWQTATEVNCYGFEVERQMTNDLLTNDNVSLSSLVNGHWKKIGFVKGSGNSNSPRNYSFIDKNPPAGTVEYRLKQIDNDGSYKYSKIVKAQSISIPKEFTLYQNYPNPFNPSTNIKYNLPYNSHVRLTVYDILGQRVKVLVDKVQHAGYYNYQWNANEMASGVYICVLDASLPAGQTSSPNGKQNYQSIKKMLLLK